jgi:hypothetical protein
MGFDPRQRRADDARAPAALEGEHRAIIPVDIAGEAVTRMVKANTQVILGTKVVGAQRIRDSRNALSESAFTHFELVSMLAVALDRLAVFEALTPTRSIERVQYILSSEFRKCCPATTMPSEDELRKIARAVLDR